jgi:hypothetical protein
VDSYVPGLHRMPISLLLDRLDIVERDYLARGELIKQIS